jgi:DNA-binding beta-propeller fold protein YncE
MSKARRNTASLPPDDTLYAVKQRKPVPHEFVLDTITPLSPRTRSMFGCLAIYVEDKIVLILRDNRDHTDDKRVARHHRGAPPEPAAGIPQHDASIPSTSATNPNSLVTFDPVTGVTGPPIPIGNSPGPLALSSDGSTLYVGLSGDNAIIPFNLQTQATGAEIFLGSDPQKGPLTASNIQVQPGNANSLVVAVTAGYSGVDGILLIENGQIISQFLNEPPNNTAVGGSHFWGVTSR